MESYLRRMLAVLLAVSSITISATTTLSFGADIAGYYINSPMFIEEVEEATIPTVSPKLTFSKIDTKSESAAKNSESENKQSSDNSKKLGRVTREFISPYTANTLYNNVAVNNQTGKSINIENLIDSFDISLKIDAEEPQVLIMHTHATEGYTKSTDGYYRASDQDRTSDTKNNVIGVGNELERVLKKGGISTVHDKTLHDNPSYSGSYDRSYKTVKDYLKKYPSIKVVIDLHRDAIGTTKNMIKPVKTVNKKDAAQVMICVGSQTGIVDCYPNWKKNLSFGVKLQQTLEVLYPGFARSLYLAYERTYNQQLSPGSIIIEFGSCANSFSEAKYSAELVGNALVSMFKMS